MKIKNNLTILIPSKDKNNFELILDSLEKQLKVVELKWRWKTYLSVCGDIDYEEIKKLPNKYSYLNLRIILRSNEKVSKVSAINQIINSLGEEYLLILDDDISFNGRVIADCLLEILNKNTKLVSSSQKILNLENAKFLRKFIYDIINIQQIKNFDKNMDPFIFGRLLLIDLSGVDKLPENIVNEDMYFQVLFYPNVKKVPSYYTYQGESKIRKHFWRVIRIKYGRDQITKFFGNDNMKLFYKYNKRKIKFSNLTKYGAYYLLCFVIYRLMRLTINFIYIFMKNRISFDSGWNR